MKLVNTEGSALLGPGSEWFWSAISAVVVAISLVAIYRQLRLQSSANALAQMDSIDKEWRTEAMIRSRLKVLQIHRDGLEPSSALQAAAVIGDYFERLGYLVRSGSVPRSLAYQYVGTQVRSWWAWCAPMIMTYREAHTEPTAGEHFEWIAGLMAEMDAKRGIINERDQAWAHKTVQGAIDGNVEALRVAEELRVVVFRPLSTPPSPLDGRANAVKRPQESKVSSQATSAGGRWRADKITK